MPDAPYSLAIGDLNGDSKLDIVTGTSSARGKVFTLLGNNDGTFATPVASPLFSFSPYTSVAIADLNGDTKPDILVSGTEGGVVDVLHGVGNGTFTYTPATDRLGTGNDPHGVVVADFNGDSKLDFAVANTGDNAIGVFFGNGSAGFTRGSPAPTLPLSNYGLGSVAAADFNGDGKTDLATATSFAIFYILLGDGHGNFTPTARPPVLNGERSPIIVTTDVNSDGKADLVVLSSLATLSVFLGNGDGTFQPAITVSAPGNARWNSFAVGDLNGDGKPDVAVADFVNYTVTPLVGSGTGTFTVGTPFPVGAYPFAVAIADLNGDGRADVVTANGTANTVTVLLTNVGNPVTFTQASNSPIAVGLFPRMVALADLNNDGKKDLVVANFNDDTISVLLGAGNGTFTAAPGSPIATSGGNDGFFAVGDLNGDGFPDLAIPDSAKNGYTYALVGNGDGSFAASGRTLGLGGPFALAIADVSGDGKRDIITVGANVSVLLNTTIPVPNPLPPPKPPGGNQPGPPSPLPPVRAPQVPPNVVKPNPLPAPRLSG